MRSAGCSASRAISEKCPVPQGVQPRQAQQVQAGLGRGSAFVLRLAAFVEDLKCPPPSAGSFRVSRLARCGHGKAGLRDAAGHARADVSPVCARSPPDLGYGAAGGQLKRLELVSARIGDVLPALHFAAACLWRYEAEGEPAMLPVAWASVHVQLAQATATLRDLRANLSSRLIRVLLRMRRRSTRALRQPGADPARAGRVPARRRPPDGAPSP